MVVAVVVKVSVKAVASHCADYFSAEGRVRCAVGSGRVIGGRPSTVRRYLKALRGRGRTVVRIAGLCGLQHNRAGPGDGDDPAADRCGTRLYRDGDWIAAA